MEDLYYVGTMNPWKKLYVVANSFDEAARKAIKYMEKDKTHKPLLDGDGSLRQEPSKECSVTSVELIPREDIVR